MKKLPELYKNLNTKLIDNNKKVYYMKENRSVNTTSVEDELNSIFNSLGYSYNIPVELVTKTSTYHTSLVAKTKENVLTIDNQTISIRDIVRITRT